MLARSLKDDDVLEATMLVYDSDWEKFLAEQKDEKVKQQAEPQQERPMDLPLTQAQPQREQPMDLPSIEDIQPGARPARPVAVAPRIEVDVRTTVHMVGPYELLEKIDEGQTTEIYKAKDTRSGLVVILKVLRPEAAANPEARQDFYDNAAMFAQLQHQCMAKTSQAGKSPDGRDYYVTERVKGFSLIKWLASGRNLPELEVIKIGIQVCLALRYAVSQGAYGLGIRPWNIMVTRDGRTKLAHIAEPPGAASGADQHLTYAYCSPENASGQTPLDIRSDMYELGATLYHAATGRPPFDGDSEEEVILKVLGEPAASPRHFRPDLSPGTCAILLKMLAKNKENRYASPNELLEALNSLRIELEKARARGSRRKGRKRDKAGRPATENVPTIPAGGNASFDDSPAGSAEGRADRASGIPIEECTRRSAQKIQGILVGVAISTLLWLGLLTALRPTWVKELAAALGIIAGQ